MSDRIRETFDAIHASERLKRSTRAHIRQKTFDYGRNRSQMNNHRRRWAAAMLFLVFTSLIGVCASTEMRCQVTKVWGIGAAAVVFATSLINLLSGKEGQVPG